MLIQKPIKFLEEKIILNSKIYSLYLTDKSVLFRCYSSLLVALPVSEMTYLDDLLYPRYPFDADIISPFSESWLSRVELSQSYSLSAI